VRNPGLDVEIEDAIMQMEAEPLPRITSLLDAQRPQVHLPRNGIVFQHPVLGGLRLPAIPAAGVSSPRRRRPAEQSGTAGGIVPHAHIDALALDTRRSPRVNFIAGDLVGDLQRLDRLDRVHQPLDAGKLQTVDEENRGQGVLRARYEEPHRAREGGPWPPRSDSMGNMYSIIGPRPSAMILWSDGESDRAITETSQVAHQPSPGSQQSPSLGGGSHIMGRDAMSQEADERESDRPHGWRGRAEQVTDMLRRYR
jgi:hypothetical protein